MNKFFIISKGTEYIRIPADQLVYISAEGNYSEIVMHDGRKHIVSFQLGQLFDMLESKFKDDERFIRIGRSLVINEDFLHIVDTAKQLIILSDCQGCYHELRASRDVLAGYKAYLEEHEKSK